MIMDDKLKRHIQCLIENVGLNATRHKDQERAMKEAKEVMEVIVKNCSIPDVVGQSEQLKCGVLGGVCPYETGDRLCKAEFKCENQVAF